MAAPVRERLPRRLQDGPAKAPLLERIMAAKLPNVVAAAAFAYMVLAGFTLQKPAPNMLVLIGVMLTGLMLATSTVGTLKSLRVSLPALLWLTLLVLSVLWAEDVPSWLGQIKLELIPLLVLPVVAALLPTDKLLQVWRLVCYGVVVQSLIATALNPGETTTRPGDIEGDGWHGTFDHKNNFSMFMVMATILVLTTETRPRLRRFMLVLLAVLVGLSQSATGLSCLLAVYLVWGVLVYRRRHQNQATRAFAWSFIVLLVLVVTTAIVFFPLIVELYGKDATLSGRTGIWSASWTAIQDRPVLGYSSGNVWLSPAEEPTRSIVSDIGFSVFHSHNGTIELLLRYGFVGLGMFLVLLVNAVQYGIRVIDIEPQLGSVILMFSTLVIVGSVGEIPVLGFWPAMLVVFHVVALRVLAAHPSASLRARSLATWRRDRSRRRSARLTAV
jgi:exopolysaccharide production protein ExoQ